jgi:hypothetical protein
MADWTMATRFDNAAVLVNDPAPHWVVARPGRSAASLAVSSMARRRSSIGFLGIFGRSHDLRQFDQALRSVDLHPKLVPEAVKLTAVSLLKDQADSDDPPLAAYRSAAEIVGYCMIGADAFAGANEEGLALAVERRIEAALVSGSSLDAQLVLLTLHAKVIQPSVVSHYGLESAGG